MQTSRQVFYLFARARTFTGGDGHRSPPGFRLGYSRTVERDCLEVQDSLPSRACACAEIVSRVTQPTYTTLTRIARITLSSRVPTGGRRILGGRALVLTLHTHHLSPGLRLECSASMPHTYLQVAPESAATSRCGGEAPD